MATELVDGPTTDFHRNNNPTSGINAHCADLSESFFFNLTGLWEARMKLLHYLRYR